MTTRRFVRSASLLAAAIASPLTLPAAPASAALLAAADLAVSRPTATTVEACGSGSVSDGGAGYWTLTATGTTTTQTRGPIFTATLPPTCVTFSTAGVGSVAVTLSFVDGVTAPAAARGATFGELVGGCASSVTFGAGPVPVIVTSCPRTLLLAEAATP